MYDHRAGDAAANVLQHKGFAGGGEKPGFTLRVADFRVSDHIDIGRLHKDFVGRAHREMV